jgi:hypothetical protein
LTRTRKGENSYFFAVWITWTSRSKFIEEAVRWRIFTRTVHDIEPRNADADTDELQANRAVREVRSERPVKRKAKLADDIRELPRVKRSPDLGDNFLLALAEGGNADCLVTGDKSGLLLLASHKHNRARVRLAARSRRSMNRPASSRYHRPV